jgi:hypothetical protein
MSMMRSITRLVVGAVLVGTDTLSERLHVWDQESSPSTALELPSKAPLEAESEPAEPPALTAEELEYQRLRYAMVGMVFDLGDRLDRGLTLADRVARLAGNIAEPFVSPVYNSRLMNPLRQGFDDLAQRGAQEVERWVAIGETEDTQSRTMTTTAMVDSVDMVVDYLASDEKIQDLIQSQSVGLIDEILEETRERAVSADNVLEMLVRNMLRRAPRSELPGPPPEVLAQAEPFQKIQGTLVRR